MGSESIDWQCSHGNRLKWTHASETIDQNPRLILKGYSIPCEFCTLWCEKLWENEPTRFTDRCCLTKVGCLDFVHKHITHHQLTQSIEPISNCAKLIDSYHCKSMIVRVAECRVQSAVRTSSHSACDSRSYLGVDPAPAHAHVHGRVAGVRFFCRSNRRRFLVR